ncbi:ATP-binding protein [Sphaerisporangium sp. NBC_01403]|uniref:ATP-binding protein n=1 Tax=Sphaerisporangium sp. NBC_01403 TaxID=2903599 RepID=UPI00324416E3
MEAGVGKAASEEELVELLVSGATEGAPVETSLRTDQRVLARVTDGIYRQPAAALRELISNAYDADATRVTIRTERPEFRRMSVDDNGNGMSPKTLVRLLHHIGGSTKRTSMGADFGVTDITNPDVSPGGRPLIGKIGIGLFSVAQLTQTFQIVTKTRGDDHQTVASVLLRQYTEGLRELEDSTYEAGKVRVWREPVPDTEKQGTSIVLTAIRPQTRETLRSIQKWSSVFASEDEITKRMKPPRYHVGIVDEARPNYLKDLGRGEYTELPWKLGDEGPSAMREVVGSVWRALNEGIPNPSIEGLFDDYLQMIWSLSLAAPLPYLNGHPFDLKSTRDLKIYSIDARRGAEPKPIALDGSIALREVAGLGSKVKECQDFEVQIDEVSLLRPISFTRFATTGATLQDSLLFVGRHREEFPAYDVEMSGGPLEFQAYFLVSPKIVPVEHRGVKIRVNDASGLPFDSKFMDFPVAEGRRLAQITCEIFVTEGFDGALNIDRESFNYSHAHVRALTKWLHLALRKVIAEEKRLGERARRSRRQTEVANAAEQAAAIVDRVWGDRADVLVADPPPVTIIGRNQPRTSDSGGYIFTDRVVGEVVGPNMQQRKEKASQLVTAITQVLAAYNLLDALDPEDQEDLLVAIREIAEVLVS